MSWFELEGYDGPHPVERSWRLPFMSHPARLQLPIRRRETLLEVTDHVAMRGEPVDPVGENTSEWLELLYEVCELKVPAPSIRMVIVGLGWLLVKPDLARCNEILAKVEVGKILPATLLAILKETYKHRDVLHARKELYQRGEKHLLRSMPRTKVDRLLGGLE